IAMSAWETVAPTACGNLGAVEHGLAGRVRQVEALIAEIAAHSGRASEHVAGPVEGLRTVSARAVREAADLAGTLDERSRALATTTQHQLSALAETVTNLEQV